MRRREGEEGPHSVTRVPERERTGCHTMRERWRTAFAVAHNRERQREVEQTV